MKQIKNLTPHSLYINNVEVKSDGIPIMEHVYLGMRVVYKEVTRSDKPKNVRKSKSSAK